MAWRIAGAAALVVIALVAVYLWPAGEANAPGLGEPLKLRLDTRLGAYNP
jgi:hypothetical protein